MKIRNIAVIASLILLNGCTTVSESTRIATSINAKQYNSVASQYMDRPTFSTIEKMSDGDSVLYIKMLNYGTSERSIRFSKKHTDSYNKLITKYLSWESQAKSKGDILKKDIGRAKTWGNGASVNLKFSFYSANQHNHLLLVSVCAVGTCLDKDAFYFDRSNAMRLKNTLTKFSSDQIGKNISDSYK